MKVEEIVDKVRKAIDENKPYCVFPIEYIEQLKQLFGDAAVFEYTSQGKKYAVLNLFKADLSVISTETTNGIKVLPVNYKDYLPPRGLKYVKQGRELDILESAFNSDTPVLFVGPKGTGKTLCVAYFAQEHSLPIIQFDCSESTKRYDLIGRFTKRGNEVVYILGDLAKAIVIANQAYENGYEGAVLCLEEINALNPQTQKILNQLLDWRRHVYVQEINKTYKLQNGACFAFYRCVHESKLLLRSFRT
jgi:midasin (ATPase involved in ribosome maturation)